MGAALAAAVETLCPASVRCVEEADGRGEQIVKVPATDSGGVASCGKRGGDILASRLVARSNGRTGKRADAASAALRPLICSNAPKRSVRESLPGPSQASCVCVASASCTTPATVVYAYASLLPLHSRGDASDMVGGGNVSSRTFMRSGGGPKEACQPPAGGVPSTARQPPLCSRVCNSRSDFEPPRDLD